MRVRWGLCELGEDYEDWVRVTYFQILRLTERAVSDRNVPHATRLLRPNGDVL